MAQNPKVTVGRVYLKPLISPSIDDIDPEKILRTLKRDVLKRLKKSIQTQDTFSDRAKTALAKAIQVEIQASSIRITVKHPAWEPMVRGMHPHQMTWLGKARAPIPIVTDTGKTIFRSATPRSLADGKWVHPGYQKTNFLEKARKETRDYVRAKAQEQIMVIIRRASKALR